MWTYYTRQWITIFECGEWEYFPGKHNKRCLSAAIIQGSFIGRREWSWVSFWNSWSHQALTSWLCPNLVLGFPECITVELMLSFPRYRPGFWLTTPKTPAVQCFQNTYAMLRIFPGTSQVFLKDLWVYWMRNWKTASRVGLMQCP